MHRENESPSRSERAQVLLEHCQLPDGHQRISDEELARLFPECEGTPNAMRNGLWECHDASLTYFKKYFYTQCEREDGPAVALLLCQATFNPEYQGAVTKFNVSNPIAYAPIPVSTSAKKEATPSL